MSFKKPQLCPLKLGFEKSRFLGPVSESKMLQKYGKVLLTKCHRVNTVGSKIRHITTRPTKPRFATPPKRPIAEDIPKDAFKDDPNFSAFLKRQAWEDEEGPDPTPEELEEENRLADAEPVTPEDIKLQEELEKASNEALLEFIDMDQIAQRTGATDVFEPPRARYKGKFWDKRGEVDVEVTRAGSLFDSRLSRTEQRQTCLACF